jgi:hypothetical protein
MDRRLEGSQSRSGRGGVKEKKKSLPYIDWANPTPNAF